MRFHNVDSTIHTRWGMLLVPEPVATWGIHDSFRKGVASGMTCSLFRVVVYGFDTGATMFVRIQCDRESTSR